MGYRPLLSLPFAACLALSAGEAGAVTRAWPGVAPCAGSLQACIDASGATDVVEITTNATIDETLTINKPMVVRAAAGYAPRLAADRGVSGNVNAAGTWTWRVEGLTLVAGFIQFTVSGGAQANVQIIGNRIERSVSGVAQISVSKAPAVSTTLNYQLQRNWLSYEWNTFDGALRAAMQVLDRGPGSSTGLIRDNRITALGNEAHGILISSQDRVHRVALAGNHIIGGRRGSIFLRQGSLVDDVGGAIEALLASNFVRSPIVGTRLAYGILGEVYDGELVVEALNNTVADARYGIDLTRVLGTLQGEVRGNIFAQTQLEGLRRAGGAAVIDGSNLYFQTSQGPSTPGLSPDSSFADPRFVFGPEDPRLGPDSPAIDAISSALLEARLAAYGVPATDGDGLRRVKQANPATAPTTLDLGAFEYGDFSLVHRAPAAPNITSTVAWPAIQGFAQAWPQSTQLWNPDGGAIGIYNVQQQSFVYATGDGRWLLRQEGLSNVPVGTGFNVFAPGRGTGRFLHQNTVANTSGSFTTLDDASVDQRSDSIVLATRNPGNGTIVDFNAAYAVNEFDGVWSVVRLDGVNMPTLGGFHVYAQPPSINAFRHVASAGNLVGGVSRLSHPLLDGNPCARVHMTPLTFFGTINNHIAGVYYSPGPQRWAIFNEDQVQMPEGAQFHVVIDAAASSCPRAVFRDGFEG